MFEDGEQRFMASQPSTVCPICHHGSFGGVYPFTTLPTPSGGWVALCVPCLQAHEVCRVVSAQRRWSRDFRVIEVSLARLYNLVHLYERRTEIQQLLQNASVGEAEGEAEAESEAEARGQASTPPRRRGLRAPSRSTPAPTARPRSRGRAPGHGSPAARPARPRGRRRAA